MAECDASMRYLARFLDATDPNASLKHLAYLLVVCAGCFWLSYDLAIKETSGGKRGIDGNWCVAFGILVGAVTTGKIVGSGPSPAPTTGAVPTTVVEGTNA